MVATVEIIEEITSTKLEVKVVKFLMVKKLDIDNKSLIDIKYSVVYSPPHEQTFYSAMIIYRIP